MLSKSADEDVEVGLIWSADEDVEVDQAYEKLVDWPSGEVGFEFHNGGGNEKYYRLGCSACRKATKRIYTKGKDNMQSRQFFCSIFNFDAGADLGIP